MVNKQFVFFKTYKYKPWHDEKCIDKIIFPIHRDTHVKECIQFDKNVTLGHALNKVEKFLSKKLTEKYINKYPEIKNYFYKYKFESINDYKIRSDLLGGYFWLESVELKSNTIILVYSN